MTTALPLDADTTPESTTSPSPTLDQPIEVQADLDLELDVHLDSNDFKPLEITSHHLSPRDFTNALSPPQASAILKWIDPKKIRTSDKASARSWAGSVKVMRK